LLNVASLKLDAQKVVDPLTIAAIDITIESKKKSVSNMTTNHLQTRAESTGGLQSVSSAQNLTR